MKSGERVQLVLERSIFPFFDKVMLGLSKFDDFFERMLVSSTVGIFSKDQTIKQRKDEILEQCASENGLSSVTLKCRFEYMKSVAKHTAIDSVFQVDFRRGEYIVMDNVINRKISLRYGQYLSEEVQEEWGNNIQKGILAEMKKLADGV